MSIFKKILSWLILGGTLFFLAKALKDNWYSVMAIHIDEAGWAILCIATGVTLLAHIWAGLVWTWMLKELRAEIPAFHFIQVYLKTNVAKYLPGNVWHHWGRIVAAKQAQVPTVTATLSVLLEPLLMAAAAAIVIIIFGNQLTTITNNNMLYLIQIVCMIALLCLFHPRFINPILNFIQKLKLKKSTVTEDLEPTPNLSLARYPLKLLFGELTFLILRAFGFILTVFALAPLQLHQLPLLLSAFCLAWLLGLITPGAPGGLGVFEATAIVVLQYHFPSALIISSAALYRLISIFAETAGALLALADERLTINF
jgi:glycosyltransferase 2 family protein